jgi:predicted enzyme related to lactoylglutathione lyase
MAIVHFALAVRDVRRAARFFELALRWKPIDRPGNIALASAWLEIAPGQEVHLLEIADYSPSPFEREYGRHIAVSIPRVEFAMMKERLREHGAEVFEAMRATPFDRFFFRDLDGYVFEVLETERVPET